VASLLLDCAIALDSELGIHVDGSVGRLAFIQYFIDNRPGHTSEVGAWKAFVMEQVSRAVCSWSGHVTSVTSASAHSETSDWLARLPTLLRELQARWSLRAPFDNDEVSCAWVAPVTRADGSSAVLKVSMPHFEAQDEIGGLRFWNGDPTIHRFAELLAADSERVRMWTFARLAAEPDWRGNELTKLAPALAP
jgi:hypothetical protein